MLDSVKQNYVKKQLIDSNNTQKKNGQSHLKILDQFYSELRSSTIKDLMKHQKEYSKTITYYYVNWEKYKRNIHQRVQKIINYLNSFLWQYFDIHTFSYFKRIVKQYSKLTNRQPQVVSINHDALHLEEVKTDYIKDIKDQQNKEYKNSINDLVELCRWNQLILPNPQYLCCSTVFYEGWRIKKNQEHRNFIIIRKQKLLQKYQLQNMICALLNSRCGGYILAGVSDNFIVEGTQINNSQCEIIRQNYLKSKRYILPRAYGRSINLCFVPVRYNPYYDKNIDHIDNTYIIRIKVQPERVKQIYFVIGQRVGYHSLYKSYVLDQDNYSYKEINDRKIYDQIVKKFDNKQNKLKLHDFELCQQPQRSIFRQQKIKYVQKDKPNNQYQKQIIYTNFIPIFPHRYQSLLLSTEKNSYLVQQLIQELTHRKSKFLIEIPYPEMRKNSGRKIWLFSHQEKFTQISQVIKKIDKGEAITFFSINKNLQTRQDFQNNNSYQRVKKLNAFKKNYSQQFGKQVQQKKGQGLLRFSFQGFQEALFSFVYLQNVGLRAMFAKQNK